MRRLKIIEACAYYIRLKGKAGDLDRLVMTNDLAELITERLKMCELDYAIADFKFYEDLLTNGMEETCNFIRRTNFEKILILTFYFNR